MPNIRVVTDSACDLPTDLAEKHSIAIVPLTIRFGEEEFVDRQDLTPQEFWERSARSPVLPETAAPSPGAFREAFDRAADEGVDGIVCIMLSSKLSATMQAAENAAREFDRVPIRVIDSQAVTMGQGLMCLAAAEAGAEGKTLDEIETLVESLVERIRIFATLDTLENLKKGGRVGGAKAMLGSMLSIKPVIEIRDGQVEEGAKPRTRSKSLRHLADKVREYGEGVENLAVMHGDAADVDDLLDLLADVYPRDEIIVGQIGAVIGAHAGPRAIGVTFFAP